ncbi:uncharacterized protein LY89DRAFT_669299 [Mollisia scopiformis]|uniref:Myb-like domain-containing protein n=1 Tax=Mollisia scopiformis TaxID=149040 RepID=A0A194XAR5_MOLSC|nr:uncharacterized protein LY89DRAFT_669299 [Mollisia scopiformis]KUJ16852.1 hypothetical protein LY89DRAFT_669299 [Mollisia scopiformis]
MATLAFKPYTYVPTAPRSNSATSRRKPASKPISIFNKFQRIKTSSAELSTLQSAAIDDCGRNELGIRENGIVTDENDDDCDLPSIEQLLYTTLQEESFVVVDQPLNNTTFKVGNRIINERGGSLGDNGSASGGNPSGSPGDPIVLLGDDDSSASGAEVDDSGLLAESAAADEGRLDSLETAIDSTTPAPPAPPCSSDGWHDIDDFPELAPRLRLAEQGASTPESLPSLPSQTSSHLSSELLHDTTSTESNATTPSLRMPSLHRKASLKTQRSQEGRLHTGRGVADEHELIDHALDTLLIDEGARKQQEVEHEQKKDDGNTEDEDEGPQQEMNAVTQAVMAEGPGESPRVANRRQSLPNLDSSPEPSHNEARSRSGGDSDSDDELNSTDLAEDNEEEPRPAKRKQSSFHDGPTRKKCRRGLQYKLLTQRRLLSEAYRLYPGSQSPLDQRSRVVATSSRVKGRFLSPTPSIPQSINTKMSLGDPNLSPSLRATLPTLTEITFRPHSTRYYSFTATIWDGCGGQGVSLAQLARLIASTGHVGKIDDFTIKPIEQHSYLLSGLSRHTSSSITAEACHDRVDATCTRPQDGKAVDARDDDDSGLSDSDPDPGSDHNGDGDSSEDELGRLSMRMNVPWDPIDEQRLLAYKKEGKSWKWIFHQFPGRTRAAVRTRLNIVQARGE